VNIDGGLEDITHHTQHETNSAVHIHRLRFASFASPVNSDGRSIPPFGYRVFNRNR